MTVLVNGTENIVSGFPWIKSYPSPLQWDAEIQTMPIDQILDDTTARYPDNIAIEFNGKHITYRALQDLANRAAKGLQALGVKPGVHVGLYLPNTPHYIIAFFAIIKAGGTVVNYSPLDAEKVVEHKIADSETDIIFTLDLQALYPLMDKMLDATRLKCLIVGNMNEMMPDTDTGRQAEQCAAVAWDEKHIRFGQLTDNDGKFQRPPIGSLTETIAILQYTGGTTGMPKGAMLTHANLTAGCSQGMLKVCGFDGLEYGKERMLAVLPLFHIYALTFNLLLGVRLGAQLILHTRFDVKQVVNDLTEKKVTVFFGVPTMYTAINAFPGLETFDFSSLKLCNSGGAPLPMEVHENFQKATGCGLQEGWGMTETCGVGTSAPPSVKHKPGACGIPLCGVIIRFASVNNPGEYVPYGEQGELCVSGPNLMKGYWKNPAATAEAITADGFLRTGDVGYMDEDGFLYIVDRIKDMILCSGYNVYPRNIEEAIYKHPAVAEVTVIGVADAYRGEMPKAFIKLKDSASAFTLDELKDFLKASLGKHEMVQAMEIREMLPKTPVGKLSKKELYDEEKRKAATS